MPGGGGGHWFVLQNFRRFLLLIVLILVARLRLCGGMPRDPIDLIQHLVYGFVVRNLGF